MSMLKFILALFVLHAFIALAQAPQNGAPRGFETGLFIGNVLPNQVPGMTEIHPQGGLRTGWSEGNGGVELSLATGKGEGVEWGDASLSLRMDIPVDVYIAMAYIGIDYIRYQGVNEELKSFGGGHVGGALLVPLGGPAGFRFDMKFNVNPGTSLLIAAGLVLTFGDSKGP